MLLHIVIQLFIISLLYFIQNGTLEWKVDKYINQNLIHIIIYITNILIFDTFLFPRRPSAPTAFYNIHKVFLLRSLSSCRALTHDPYLPHISVETCYFGVAWKTEHFVCACVCFPLQFSVCGIRVLYIMLTGAHQSLQSVIHTEFRKHNKDD